MQFASTKTITSSSGDISLKRKLQGLLLFRLLLAFFFLFLTLLVQSRREDSDLLSAHLEPLYFFSCTLFLFTIVAALSLKHVQHLRRFAYVQLFFDVVAVTVLISLSGGVESLFSFLYMPVIISAAVFLYLRGSLITASMCSIFYGTLLDLQYFGWISPLQIVVQTSQLRDSGSYLHGLLMNIAAFYLVAYLSGYLAEELQKSSQQIEEQKKDYHQLEALHRNIVESVNSGLMTISLTGYVLFFNRAAREILAMSAEEIQGRPFNKIFPELDPLGWPRESSQSIPTTLPNLNRIEVRYQRPTGEELRLGCTISLLQKTEEEEASGWIFIFQDLTELKAMEEHMRRIERVAFAGNIAAEIAHEIKNPLAAMSGAVEMLQDAVRQHPVHSRLTGIILREVSRMNELVTDFLWLAKQSRKPERIEEVPVLPMIEEILALLKARNKIVSGHEIRTDFLSSPIFLMDPNHLRQIIWNLLENGLEAMPDGGDLFIRVGVSNGDNPHSPEGRIDIGDTGSGIPDEIKDRIFEPFFTTKKSGTGLGLSIVCQLVENAGGRIEVSQSSGAPTTFSLFFPLSPSFSLAN